MKKITSLFFALLTVVTVTAQSWQSYTPHLAGWSVLSPTYEKAEFIEYAEGRTNYYFGMASSTQNFADAYVTLPTPSYDTYFGVGIGVNSNGVTAQNAIRVDLVKGSNIAHVLPYSGAWTGSGGKSMRFSVDYRSQTETKHNIVYMSNSLMNYNLNSLAPNGHYVARTIHTNLCDSIPGLMACLTAESGMSTASANQNFSTKYAPYIDSNSVVINFLATVDFATLGLSVDSVWNATKEIADKVHDLGGKIIVVTMIPRAATTDSGYVYTRGLQFNDSVRTNTGGVLDGVIDPTTNTIFDSKADANNTIYYNADDVHLATNGQNILAGIISYNLRILFYQFFP